MKQSKRTSERVTFSRVIDAKLMAIDGTWQRSCWLMDISDVGARLEVAGTVAGLNLDEFFLMLSPNGPVHRRCKMAWINGDEFGVTFIRGDAKRVAQAAGHAARLA